VVSDPKFAEQFKSQELSYTLNAFAKSGVKNEELFTLLGDRILNEPKFVELFEPQHISNTLNAFAKLEFKPQIYLILSVIILSITQIWSSSLATWTSRLHCIHLLN
jgi:hypothetical protein